jgi:diadenosine tetraphosphate (Ap4A) HIT family hydrolase
MCPHEPAQCPFCDVDPSRIQLENEVGIAVVDAFPVSEGHILVVPKKHVASLYDLSSSEQAALWQLAGEVRGYLSHKMHPDGFNVGVNDGEAAGQTVMHAHIHVIPRRMGDDPDPRGGVRRVVAGKAQYWKKEK